jgi:formylmethanofuran dehydrogenase subunit E
MHELGTARKAMETMIREGDLEGLLRAAEAIHGHRCPYLALGIKAGHYAMNSLYSEGEPMSPTMAIVESNACFADGIQVVTGCSFGNNHLIFKDLGKNAATVVRQEDGKAIRLVVRANFREMLFARYPAAGPLFEKVLIKREATQEDHDRFRHLWEAVARREMEEPLEEQFLIQPLTVQVGKAPLSFKEVICSRCQEGVLETKARFRDGHPVCLACAGEKFFLLTGQGIDCFCVKEA